MLGVNGVSRSTEKHALRPGRRREGLDRRRLDRMIDQLHIDKRRGERHRSIVRAELAQPAAYDTFCPCSRWLVFTRNCLWPPR